MKIYQVRKADTDLGVMLEWCGSRAAAAKALKQHQKERNSPADRPEGIEVMDIPTTKQGLLDWLNVHFTTDNG